MSLNVYKAEVIVFGFSHTFEGIAVNNVFLFNWSIFLFDFASWDLLADSSEIGLKNTDSLFVN